MGSVDQKRAAIDLTGAALDAVAHHYGLNRGTYFDTVAWGGVESMVRLLEAGRRASDAQFIAKALAMSGGLDANPI